MKTFDYKALASKEILPLFKEVVIECAKMEHETKLQRNIPFFYGLALKNTEKKTVYEYGGSLTGGLNIVLFDNRIERHVCVARGMTDTIAPDYYTLEKKENPLYERAQEWSDLLRMEESDALPPHILKGEEPTVFDHTALFEKDIEPMLVEALDKCSENGIKAFYTIAYKNMDNKTLWSSNGNYLGGDGSLAEDRFPAHFDVSRGMNIVPPGFSDPMKDIASKSVAGWDQSMDGYVEEIPE